MGKKNNDIWYKTSFIVQTVGSNSLPTITLLYIVKIVLSILLMTVSLIISIEMFDFLIVASIKRFLKKNRVFDYTISWSDSRLKGKFDLKQEEA